MGKPAAGFAWGGLAGLAAAVALSTQLGGCGVACLSSGSGGVVFTGLVTGDRPDTLLKVYWGTEYLPLLDASGQKFPGTRGAPVDTAGRYTLVVTEDSHCSDESYPPSRLAPLSIYVEHPARGLRVRTFAASEIAAMPRENGPLGPLVIPDITSP